MSPDISYHRAREVPLGGGMKPSNESRTCVLGLYLAGYVIGSIKTRHGTSLKPSSSLGDDDVASSFILLVVPIQLGGGTVPRKTIVDLETTINI